MARAALSLPFSGLSGALGDNIVTQLPDGPQVRRRTPVRKGRTPAQDEARVRMESVSRAWAALDQGAYEAWGRYAISRAWRNPATGAIVTPKAYCLFVGLASKARQVSPGLDLAAFMPPERNFTGDGVAVRVSPTPSPTVPPCARDEGRAISEASAPRLQGEPSLRFSADRANPPGVVTELLVQPLANARRAAYSDKYASRGFVAFGGAETVEVPVKAGAYACAFRFVRAATGEETGLFELGVVVAP